MYCSKCGQPLGECDQFCPNCGRRTSGGEQTIIRSRSKPGGSKIWLCILIGILSGVALAAILSIINTNELFYRNSNGLVIKGEPLPAESGEAYAAEFETTPQEQTAIKIGIIMPLTGPLSMFGSNCLSGIKMAVDEYNEKGGVLGRRIELVLADDAADPRVTIAAFVKQIKQDRIVGLIGALTSNCTMAITNEAQYERIVVVSPTSARDTVTSANDYIFRACLNDSFQGRVAAQFARENLKAAHAAILYDKMNEFSMNISQGFAQSFTELGGTIVEIQANQMGETEFLEPIEVIKQTKPDVVFVPVYYTGAELIRQMRSLGMITPILGSSNWDGIDDYVEDVGTCFYSNDFSPDAKDKNVRTFVQAYRARYGNMPDAFAALSYDAACILFEAIERAGSIDPEKIKAAMIRTDKRFVTGQISFDAQRNPVKSVFMVELVAGDTPGKPKAVYAAMVDPTRKLYTPIAAAGRSPCTNYLLNYPASGSYPLLRSDARFASAVNRNVLAPEN